MLIPEMDTQFDDSVLTFTAAALLDVKPGRAAAGDGVDLAAGGGVEAALSEPDFLFSTIGLISSFNLPTKSKVGLITTSSESCDMIVD